MKTTKSTTLLAATTLTLTFLGGLLAPSAALAQAHGRYGSDQDRGRSQERYQDRDDRDHPRDDGWYRDNKGKWKQDKNKRKNNKNNNGNNRRDDGNNGYNNDRRNDDRRNDNRNDRYNPNIRFPNGGYPNGGYGNDRYPTGGYPNGGYNNDRYGNDRYGNDRYGNGDLNTNRNRQVGVIAWRGSVDDVVEVYFQGSRAWTRRISGNEVDNTEARFSRALPRFDSRVSLTKNEGRGVAFVRQQPDSGNNYTTIVRIEDKNTGVGNYRLTLNWTN